MTVAILLAHLMHVDLVAQRVGPYHRPILGKPEDFVFGEAAEAPPPDQVKVGQEAAIKKAELDVGCRRY